MTRLGIWCAAGLAITMAAGCERSRGEAELETTARVGDEDGAPTLITAEGCLTSSNDRFVLTELKRDEASSEAYRLVGRDEDLRAHVGKRVQISGETEPEQVVDLRQSTEPGSTPAAGTSGSNPQVGTTATTRIEVHDLRVRTIAATDEPCEPAR